jgi:hypothetical protein
MTDRVLTDGELIEAAMMGDTTIAVNIERLRAVERAVLASLYDGKAPAEIAFKIVNSMGGYQVMASCVPEAEARTREREAAYFVLGYVGRSDRQAMDEVDRRYPSVLPKAPPPLVLSTGTWVEQREDMRWQLRGEDRYFVMTPTCATAADADALAAWLRQYGEAK